METTVTTPKGQILVPRRLRAKYGIKPGVKVIFEETENGVIIKPMNEKHFKSFMGILKSTGDFKDEMKNYKEEEMKLEEAKANRTFKSKTKPKAK